MVKLLIGHKGSGKTKKMIELANEKIETSNGSVIFINKNHRLMYDLDHRIRDIETMFIDSILKHADVTLGDLPEFIDRIKKISKNYDIEFVVSLSAAKEEMIGVDFTDCQILN